MKIRSATLSDLETLVDNNLQLALQSEKKTLDVDVLRRGVQRALSSPTHCRYLVAEQGGKVIGQLMITYEVSDWRDGMAWWLQSVYVVPEARGRGVLRALVDEMRRLAELAGDVRALRLYVDKDNRSAQEVYEKLNIVKSNYLVYEQGW